METLITSIATLNSGSTNTVSIAISLIALLSGAWFYFKKTKIEEYTSVGTLQHQQIESLMAQVKLLSEELSKARVQLSDIHEQNIKLMQQIRDSNSRIQELEDLLGGR